MYIEYYAKCGNVCRGVPVYQCSVFVCANARIFRDTKTFSRMSYNVNSATFTNILYVHIIALLFYYYLCVWCSFSLIYLLTMSFIKTHVFHMHSHHSDTHTHRMMLNDDGDVPFLWFWIDKQHWILMFETWLWINMNVCSCSFICYKFYGFVLVFESTLSFAGSLSRSASSVRCQWQNIAQQKDYFSINCTLRMYSI